ncbi:hypothetical protein [Maribacter luteus]|uniref:Uncharacterized protein n=1 Tax=Maribacter luteus TaxID=2594478 RepID=A0A6I2MS37_9FLAO|nr:hypothetical protein [Maribacter luteus]MRX65375.1 hypothetical protein [Maribacter luteus]
MKNTLLFNVANSKGQHKAKKPDLKNSFFQPKNIVEINEGHYFIYFGNAFFGTVQITAKQSQRDSLITHLGEKLAPPNKIYRNPGVTIRYRKPKLKNLDATPPPPVNVVFDQYKRNTTGASIMLPDSIGVVILIE